MAIYKTPKFVYNQENKIKVLQSLENHRRYFSTQKNTVLHTLVFNKKDYFQIDAQIYDSKVNQYSQATFTFHKKSSQLEYFLADQHYKKQLVFIKDFWDFEAYLQDFYNHLIIKK